MFENMAIRELAKLCGVSTRTLRYYEEIGLLKPARLENNYRTYDFDAVGRVEMILTLRRSGMRLEQIGELLAGSGSVERTLDAQRQSLLEEIGRLERSVAFIDEQRQLARLYRRHGPGRLFVEARDCRQYEVLRRVEKGELMVLLEYGEVGMAIEPGGEPDVYIVRAADRWQHARIASAFFTGERRIRRRQRAFAGLLEEGGCACKSLIHSRSCCLIGGEEVHLMWCEVE